MSEFIKFSIGVFLIGLGLVSAAMAWDIFENSAFWQSHKVKRFWRKMDEDARRY